jgi:hypothetical protein
MVKGKLMSHQCHIKSKLIAIVPWQGLINITTHKFQYVEYLVDSVYEQLCDFHTFTLFKYQSYLVYFLPYFQSSYFEHLNLRKLDEQGNPLLVIEHSSVVIKHETNEGFKNFVDIFLLHTHIDFHGDPPPYNAY